MEWIVNLLTGMGISTPLGVLLVQMVYAAILSFVAPVVVVVAFTYMERKIIARIQDRIGPNRAGPFGVLQGFADAIKMFTKEDITPQNADRFVYNLAPGLAAIAAVLVYGILPFAPGVIGTDLNVGILVIIAIGGVGIMAILMAGWSSNNKYALIGAYRSVAQIIAYEIPMVVAVLSVVVMSGSMSMGDIIKAQDVPYIIMMPIAFLIFFLASIAEVGRSPFDLIEAESEIIAGYHIEYSGMKFALFFIGEYMHMFAAASIATTLFLGGWKGPWAEQIPFLGFVYFVIKNVLLIFVMMWFRGTLPRFRIDHLLSFGWKFLVPLGLGHLMLTALVVKLTQPGSTAGIVISAGPLHQFGLAGQTFLLLLGNIILAVIALSIVALAARRSRSLGFRALANVD
jgi:NADH-quinone oxidoreductase subunit H